MQYRRNLSMDSIIGHILSYIFGITNGIIATICYDYLCRLHKKRKREKNNQHLHAIDLLVNDTEKRVEAIVSYGDSHAIQIAPLLHNGCFILSGSIDLSHKPKKAIKREFVMALMVFIPAKDWSAYVECGYRLKFKIRGNIRGVKLEIKGKDKRKLLDSYVPVSDHFEEKNYPLEGPDTLWQQVEELCFTIFCDPEYIEADKGHLEIIKCRLEK